MGKYKQPAHFLDMICRSKRECTKYEKPLPKSQPDCGKIRKDTDQYSEIKFLYFNSIVKAAVSSDDDSDSEEDLLKPRKKSEAERSQEEADHLEWLKGQKDTLDEDNKVGIELVSL